MADLRYDPVHDSWVAMAETRTERPNEYQPKSDVVPLARCPFCGGNEDETPQAIAAYDWDPQRSTAVERGTAVEKDAVERNGAVETDQPDWLCRVIPNRFPAFTPLTDNTCEGPARGQRDCRQTHRDNRAEPFHSALEHSANNLLGPNHGPYRQAPSPHSRQELIIESPRHVESYSQLSHPELLASFQVYRQRLRAYRDCPELQYALLFKNCRPEAGASLAHVHSQLFGLDFIPATIARRHERLQRPTTAAGHDAGSTPHHSLLTQMLQWELAADQRVVANRSHWTMFCPFASRFSCQTWIVPTGAGQPLWEQSDQALAELAFLVQDWVRAVEYLWDRPAYNVLFHQPLLRGNSLEGQSFVELFVRIGSAAGFEWGSDCWINVLSPETAAQQLRTALAARQEA
jgi:UDPglucose--hexose-1-phosphate uridylyltransferase